MSMRILSASDVKQISASFLPIDLQCLMAQVFHAVTTTCRAERGAGQLKPAAIQVPHRTAIATDNHNILFMPARLSTDSTLTSLAVPTFTGDGLIGYGTSIKIVSVPKISDPRGLPGTTLVMDEETGSVKAIVNARKLTALRNAAGSLLSTGLVAKRAPKHIVAFGAGNQIESHLDLHLRFFPQVEKCTIINRTLNDRAKGLVNRLSKTHGQVQFSPFSSASATQEIEDAVSSAGLIICATSSTVPLFPSNWVKAGTHVILIGSFTPEMQEIDTNLVRRATKANGGILLVDSRSACFLEAGELIKAGVTHEEVTEIGEILPVDGSGNLDISALKSLLLSAEEGFNGDSPNPTDFGGPVTIFKSVGIGLQDVAISAAVVHKAEKLNIGQKIDHYDD